MGSSSKLISGILLFILGILLAFVTYVFNLITIFFVIGILLCIGGIIFMIIYFVNSSDKNGDNSISNFISDSKDKSSSSYNNNSSNGPLKIRSDYNEDEENKLNLEELNYDDYDRSNESSSYLEKINSDYDTPVNREKAVLNIVEEREVNFDKELNFTPNYQKPLKITRKPQKRAEDYFEDKYIYYGDVEDKTSQIQEALEEDNVIIPQHEEVIEPEVEESRDIKIDINNPESLPVPKLLKSFVVSKNGFVTSEEALNNVVLSVKKEVMLEISNLNGLSDTFISNIPSVYSRIILEESSIHEPASLILISSLLNKGVHIKTIPKVNTINLIADDSYAIIISESSDGSEVEYGAIYDDRISISEIRHSFDITWDIAKDLNENMF